MTYFFITSLGRSGTKFFANLLNQPEEVMCYHEPYKEDYINLSLSYYSTNLKVLEDNLKKRFEDVIQKMKSHPNCNYYGEVNSLLRYNTKWLKNNLNAKVVHIVRDPRKVVPSIYSRNVFKEGSSHLEIVPKNDDFYSSKWNSMNRFEKICWYWTHTNDMLLKDVDKVFRFEDLINDYGVFIEMCNYLEIPEVSKNIWQSEISKPRNTSKRAIFRKRVKSLIALETAQIEKIGAYDQWSLEMKEQYKSICGNTASKLGYGI